MKLIQLCRTFQKQAVTKYKKEDVSDTQDIEKQSPNIDKILKYHFWDADIGDDIYAHFSDKPDRFGLNPNRIYDTPVGIYGYPPAELITNEADFAKGRPYIHLFKVNGRCLDLAEYTEDDLNRDIKILIKNGYDIDVIENAKKIAKLQESSVTSDDDYLIEIDGPRQETFGRCIWLITKCCSKGNSKEWAKILNIILKYDYAKDFGLTIIRKDEPQIIVFVNSGTSHIQYIETCLKSVLMDKTRAVSYKDSYEDQRISKLIEDAKQNPTIENISPLYEYLNNELAINALCGFIHNNRNLGKQILCDINKNKEMNFNPDIRTILIYLLKNNFNADLLAQLDLSYPDMKDYFYNNVNQIFEIIKKYPQTFSHLIPYLPKDKILSLFKLMNYDIPLIYNTIPESIANKALSKVINNIPPELFDKYPQLSKIAK